MIARSLTVFEIIVFEMCFLIAFVVQRGSSEDPHFETIYRKSVVFCLRLFGECWGFFWFVCFFVIPPLNNTSDCEEVSLMIIITVKTTS